MLCTGGEVKKVTIQGNRVDQFLKVDLEALIGWNKCQQLGLLWDKLNMILLTVFHSKVKKTRQSCKKYVKKM